MGSAFGLINTGANLAAFKVAFYYLLFRNILSLTMGLLLKKKNSGFEMNNTSLQRLRGIL